MKLSHALILAASAITVVAMAGCYINTAAPPPQQSAPQATQAPAQTAQPQQSAQPPKKVSLGKWGKKNQPAASSSSSAAPAQSSSGFAIPKGIMH